MIWSTYACRSTVVPFSSLACSTAVVRRQKYTRPMWAECWLQFQPGRYWLVQKCANSGAGRRHPSRRRHIEPNQTRITAKPGFLVPNVPVGIKSDPLDRLLEARFSQEIRDQLAVAEATHGRSGRGNAGLKQRAHFLNEPSLNLIAYPVVDGAIEIAPWHRQPDFESRVWRRAPAFLS